MHAVGRSTDRHSPRETRHLDYIAQFTTDVRHVRGCENLAPDALSRVSAIHASQPPMDDLDELADAQREDADLLVFRQSGHGLRLRDTSLGSGRTLVVDDSTGTPRPLVPASLRRRVFDRLHGLAHPGVRASQELVGRRFVWPGMRNDIRRWTQACDQCQRTKVHRHTKTPTGEFRPPDDRFDHVHVDLVGPLPISDGYQYLLTCVDRYTRWVEATPLRDMRAQTVAQAFISVWVARFGVPSIITSDRGSQFESTLWAQMSQILGTARQRTTSWHPQCNGLVERFHRQLKAALRAADNTQWTATLPIVLLGIRSALKTDLGCSAAELVYGTTLRLPGEFYESPAAPTDTDPASYAASLRAAMRRFRYTAPRTPSSASYIPRRLQDATHVFVRRDAVKGPLDKPYDGPFTVLSRTDKTITVERRGKRDTVSLDRVKPAHMDCDTGATAGSLTATNSRLDTEPDYATMLALPFPPPLASGAEQESLGVAEASATAPTPPPARLASSATDQPPPAPPAAPPDATQPTSILRTRSGRASVPPVRYPDRRVCFAPAAAGGELCGGPP